MLLENHPTQFLALKYKKNYKKYQGKYYYHCHNEFPGLYGCDKIIKNTEKFICVSEYISKYLMDFLKIEEKEKFEVLKNCVNEKLFRKKINESEKIEIKKQCGIDNEDKIIIFTGRIVPEKGVKELILSMKKIKNENYKLLVLGAPLNEFKVKTLYQEEVEKSVCDINRNIHFTGFIKYEEIYKYYAIADLLVLPSIWEDPAPLTIIEALVSGVPIITTNSGGIPEYINEKCAVIVNKEKNLIDNLANEIDNVLNDDEMRKKMSQNCIVCSKELTMEKYYTNFCNIIRSEND